MVGASEPELRTLAGDRDPDVRAAALASLGDRASELVSRAAADLSAPVRKVAISVLANDSVLERMATDDSPEVATAALVKLASRRGRAAVTTALVGNLVTCEWHRTCEDRTGVVAGPVTVGQHCAHASHGSCLARSPERSRRSRCCGSLRGAGRSPPGRVVVIAAPRKVEIRVPAGRFWMGVDEDTARAAFVQCQMVFPALTGASGAGATRMRVDFCADYADMLAAMSPRQVFLDAFAIDRDEVSVDDYRTCVDRGRVRPRSADRRRRALHPRPAGRWST